MRVREVRWRLHVGALAALALAALTPLSSSTALAAGGDQRASVRKVDCKSTGRTVVADATARIFQQTRGDYAGYYWGCTYKTRRAHLLGTASEVSNLRLVRRRVAFENAPCERLGCPGGHVVVHNLSTGAARSVQRPLGDIFDGDLQLTPSGTVIYINPTAVAQSPIAVFSFRKGEPQQLDAGDVAQGSLALHGNRAYWMKGGAPQTALVP